MLQRYDLRQLGSARCLSSTMEKTTMQLQMFIFRASKGEVMQFFIGENLYRTQTKNSFNRHFSSKTFKVGQKSGQSVKNSQNKDQKASDLGNLSKTF